MFKKYWARSKKFDYGQNIFELADGIDIGLPEKLDISRQKLGSLLGNKVAFWKSKYFLVF